MQLNVGVLLVKADGTVAMPHSMCAEGGAEGCAAKLQDFVERLRCEPLLIKAYTAQARALPSHLHLPPIHTRSAHSHP